MSTIGFRATKILSTVKVEITVDGSFQSCKNPANSLSCLSCQSQLPKLFQLCKLIFLLDVAVKTTKILKTVGFEIPVNSSFQTYPNLFNCGAGISANCSFQSYLTSWRRYAFCQLSEMTFHQLMELTTNVFIATENLKNAMLFLSYRIW